MSDGLTDRRSQPDRDFDVVSDGYIGTRERRAAQAVGVSPDMVKAVSLPTDRASRKSTPIWSGFINYFPLAIAAVAQLSHSANEVHNPGEPLHWSKGKSNDHRDCMGRHLVEIDEYDVEPDHDYHYLHAVKNAWRAMAYLQTVLETGKPPRIPANKEKK